MLRLFKRAICLVAIPLLLIVTTSCGVVPLFQVDEIIVKVNASNEFTGVSVTFSARTPNADSYLWDFGDGGTGAGQVVSHLYSTLGIFTVTLTITTSGESTTFSQEINIATMSGGSGGLSEIVFECGNGPGNSDLCGINFDGSGFQILLETGSEITRIDTPKINASGQVVFVCFVQPAASVDSLCGINSDGSGFRIIRLITAGASRDPDINDAGEIVYECLAPSTFITSLCGVEFDGSNFHVIDTAADSNDESKDPTINNAGQIAYNCEDNANNDNLCVNDFSGSGRVVLDTNLSVSGFVEPTINSSGQIAYVCENVSGFQSICVINFDGTGQNRITDPSGTNDEDITPVINDFGQIVYNCELDQGSSSNSLCVINFDGTGQAILDQATDSDDENTRPSINNAGEIVYVCDIGASVTSLCGINFDGSGFIILRNAFGDPEMRSNDPDIR